ncbi:DUF6783 domain-containing protein [Robinsoniella peoriensis]
MRGKYAAKWGVQMVGTNFKTRSGTLCRIFHGLCRVNAKFYLSFTVPNI